MHDHPHPHLRICSPYQDRQKGTMSALSSICGRSLPHHPSVQDTRTVKRLHPHARHRCRTTVRCLGSEQGSAPEDAGAGSSGAAKQTPIVQGSSDSFDTPQLQAPSTVDGPRADQKDVEAFKDSAQLGDNDGVREDAPGSAPELDGAAEAQATPKAQGSDSKQRRKVDT